MFVIRFWELTVFQGLKSPQLCNCCTSFPLLLFPSGAWNRSDLFGYSEASRREEALHHDREGFIYSWRMLIYMLIVLSTSETSSFQDFFLKRPIHRPPPHPQGASLQPCRQDGGERCAAEAVQPRSPQQPRLSSNWGQLCKQAARWRITDSSDSLPALDILRKLYTLFLWN